MDPLDNFWSKWVMPAFVFVLLVALMTLLPWLTERL